MRLADFVVGEVHPRHSDLMVTADRAVDGPGVRKIARLHGDGSRYCPNVLRSHSTSSMYLSIGANGVALRCWCRKQTCPSYVGWTLPLSTRGAQWIGLGVSRSGLPPGFA